MKYSLTKQADKQLRDLPISSQLLIIKKVKHYLSAENPLHYADSIEGEHGKVYRFRGGDFRIIFDWLGDSILVTKIRHRRDVYQR